MYYEQSETFNDYHLILSINEKKHNIGSSNEPLFGLEISWSPDETFLVVKGGMLRIFQIKNENNTKSVNLVFYRLTEVSAIYWSDEMTAYLSSVELRNDIISRLDFDPDSETFSETIYYKEKESGLFAYVPASISPNERYLVLEYRYEGPPQLEFMDTTTGKISRGDNYKLGKDPNYTWNGNVFLYGYSEGYRFGYRH